MSEMQKQQYLLNIFESVINKQSAFVQINLKAIFKGG